MFSRVGYENFYLRLKRRLAFEELDSLHGPKLASIVPQLKFISYVALK